MKKQTKKNKEKLTRIQKARKKTREYRKKFRGELKKTISTAIVAAFGFIIALSWKEVITEYVNTITKTSPVQGRLIQAIIVTIIAVIGIIIVTKIFAHEEK